MLEAMRRGSQNILVKLLLGALAVSFVVWGVGDVFRGGSNSAVATVGEEEIQYSEYYNLLQREISRFQQILGRSLTPEQIEQYDLKRRVLDQLVDNKLIRLRVDALNLKVGDQVAKTQLVNNSLFFDDTGSFNAETFKTVLRSNGLNENEYVVALKEDTAVRMLIDTLSISPSSLDTEAKALYKYRNEYRIADLVYIPANYTVEVEEPSETELLQYYQDNTAQFEVPEIRKVTYIKYGLDDVKNSIEISEEALNEEYQNNLESFKQPEKRDVVQYLFESETDAQMAFEDIKNGKVSLYEDKKVSLGEVALDGLPDEINEPVFNLEVNQYSEPVKTELGWHILTVNKIIEPTIKPFEEVRKELENYLKESKASDIFYDSAVKIEDELAGGLSLEDLAQKFDLVIHNVPSINNRGQGATGKPLTDIPEPETFVSTAFVTESGDVSPMQLLSDNATYILVRVDEVTPKRVKALDEIKGTVSNLWKEVQKRKKLAELAQQVAMKIKEGGDPKVIANTMELKFKTSDKIKRPSPDMFLNNESDIPNQLSAELFSIEKGDSTSYYLSGKGEYVIGKLADIKDGQYDKNRVASLEQSLKRDFTDDILRQYNYFLRKEYPVMKNETLLNSSSL